MAPRRTNLTHGGGMELLVRGPITRNTAPVHLQRAWYVAMGTATVMGLAGVFSLSFNLVMGAIIVVGLGHGMMQHSWVSAGALLLYLFSLLAQAGWRQGQPVLIVLALAVAYFLVQGVRATWWWREHEPPPGEDLSSRTADS
jgi:hypothetical protein